MTKAVPDELKDSMRETLGALKNSSQFSPRPGQNVMFGEIAKAVSGVYENKKHGIRSIVVEGQTGAGKTLGYLLPALSYQQHYNAVNASAIKNEKANRLTVVVATANVALQQQIFNTDLPMLTKTKALSGIKAELVVGRGRYLCVRDALQNASNDTENDSLTMMVDKVQSGEWSGMRDDLSGNIPDKVWSAISANAETCSNRACPHYDECPFIKARKNIYSADLVVTSHAMVYANLALLRKNPDSSILPSPENSILIMDEAHHVPNGYRDSQVLRLSLKALGDVIKNKRDLLQSLRTVGRKSGIYSVDIDKPLIDLDSSLKQLLKDTNQLISTEHEPRASNLYRFKGGLVPAAISKQLTERLKPALSALFEQVEILYGKLSHDTLNEMQNNPGEASHIVAVKRLYDLLEKSLTCIVGLCHEKTQSANYAKWIDRPDESNAVTFHYSPIRVSKKIYTDLVKKHHSSVFTSATLRSLSKFAYYYGDMGFQKDDGTQFLLVESPFDYTRSTLNVTKNIAPPQQEAAHTDAIAKRLTADFSPHSAGLLLFSSKRQMNRFVQSAPADVKEIMLVQYSAPRDELIKIHKARIDKGERSLLIGVQSFSEGLDLPAQWLTFVAIAKLPFPDLSSPIESAKSEAIEQTGGSPFFLQMLPAASKALIQSVGRLVRSNNCQGDVFIYDSRLATKGYGKQLLAALPSMQQRIID